MLPGLCRCRGVLLFVVLAACAGCKTQAPSTNAEALDRLLRLMQQRLGVMHDVARWKWNERKPIADPDRERELLDAMSDRGRGKGLDPVFVRSFFTAQIEAAKLLQRADFDQWQANSQGPFPSTADLSSLRKRIDGVNRELIEALVVVEPSLSRPDARKHLARQAEEILTGEGVDDAIREAAVAPLRRK